MNTTHRPTRPAASLHKTIEVIEVIDVMAEAGLLPADEINAPAWLAARYDGGLNLTNERSIKYLVAAYRSDELMLQLLTGSGSITEELGFRAPDGEVSTLTAAAFASVVTAWIEVAG